MDGVTGSATFSQCHQLECICFGILLLYKRLTNQEISVFPKKVIHLSVQHIQPYELVYLKKKMTRRPCYAGPFWMILQKKIAPYQTILDHIILYYTLLDNLGQGMRHSGQFWTILNRFEICLYILDHFGPFQAILGHRGLFGTILDNFGPYWTILELLEPVWTILSLIRPVWISLDLFKPIWTHFALF